MMMTDHGARREWPRIRHWAKHLIVCGDCACLSGLQEHQHLKLDWPWRNPVFSFIIWRRSYEKPKEQHKARLIGWWWKVNRSLTKFFPFQMACGPMTCQGKALVYILACQHRNNRKEWLGGASALYLLHLHSPWCHTQVQAWVSAVTKIFLARKARRTSEKTWQWSKKTYHFSSAPLLDLPKSNYHPMLEW